ncbi:MAG TPA: hypothetical protein VF828_02485 [Patescibacteria group bacterium]
MSGDYITDFVSIYLITSIETTEGKDEPFVHYKPVSGTDKVFTAVIPLKNLVKTGLRKVLTAKDAKEVVENLKNSEIDVEYNTQVAKEEVYQNQPKKVVPVLRYLWKNGEKLSKVDRELMEQILSHLSNEVSFVTNKTYEETRSEIEANLAK